MAQEFDNFSSIESMEMQIIENLNADINKSSIERNLEKAKRTLDG